MRLRKVKHAKTFIEDNKDKIIPNPEDLKGCWNKEFKNSNPIQVEIGCGKGRFIFEKAKKHPDINYIGIEKFDSVIVRALEKLLEEPLSNVRLIRIDAENIEKVFEKSEIDKIYLNFSDPWPKNSHIKRRLTSDKYLERYSNILKDSAHIEMKTDNFGLFSFSMLSFNSHNNYVIENINLNLYKNLPDDNVQTEFEKKFVEKGNLIFFQSIRFQKENI